MIISDLSYLEVANEEILGGRGRRGRGGYDVDGRIRIKKEVDIYVNVYETYDKAVYGFADIYGNLATAESAADAFGYNTLTETITFTDATDYSSESYSGAVSAVSY
ncbi:MAG: hypothetical protein ACFB4J_00750 [Elainellaceae cyanobacterium]